MQIWRILSRKAKEAAALQMFQDADQGASSAITSSSASGKVLADICQHTSACLPTRMFLLACHICMLVFVCTH